MKFYNITKNANNFKNFEDLKKTEISKNARNFENINKLRKTTILRILILWHHSTDTVKDKDAKPSGMSSIFLEDSLFI